MKIIRKTQQALLMSFFLLVLMLLTQTVSSQYQITTDMLDVTWQMPDSVMKINLTDITSSAEATSTIITETHKSIPDTAVRSGYIDRFNKLSDTKDTLYSHLAEIDTLVLGSRAVQNYQGRLDILKTQFSKLGEEVQATTKDLQQKYIRVDFLKTTWTKTLEAEIDDQVLESVQARTNQILFKLDSLEKRTVRIVNELLELGDLILTSTQTVKELVNLVKVAQIESQRSIFTQTYPPIWIQISPKEMRVKTSDLYDSVIRAYRQGISDIYSLYKTRIFINLALFVLMLIISFYMRRFSRNLPKEQKDDRITTFLRIFSRPVAVALLLALLMILFIYPKAPTVLADMVSLAIIIPLVIVALKVLPGRLKYFVYLISVMFLLEEVVETVKYDTFPLPRLLIIIIGLIGIGYIVLVLSKKARIQAIKNPRRRNLIIFIFILTLLIVAASLISNFLGFVPLSFMFIKGVVISTIAGLLLYVSVTIVEGFFTLIIMGKSYQMISTVKNYGDMLIDKIIKVVKLITFFYWLTVMLRQFQLYNPVLEWLLGILNSKWIINPTTTISLRSILLFFLTIFLTIWITKFIRLVLEKEVFPRVKLGRGIPGIISLIIRYSLITVGFIIGLATLGINLDKLTILVGALGVGIGFGLQDLINNLISGFILIFERPIQVGDVVQFGTREGKVKEIGIRASTIRTYDGSEVIVPNGKLISNELINLTLSDPLMRIEIDIGVAFGTEPQSVIDILVYQANLHPDTEKIPKPFAIYFGFGDYSLKFKLYAYTYKINERLRIRSELNLAIHNAIKDANIEIPYPQQELSIKMAEKPLDKPPTLV